MGDVPIPNNASTVTATVAAIPSKGINVKL
jgi:hypothetical protein